jgi:hypothetical protein
MRPKSSEKGGNHVASFKRPLSSNDQTIFTSFFRIPTESTDISRQIAMNSTTSMRRWPASYFKSLCEEEAVKKALAPMMLINALPGKEKWAALIDVPEESEGTYVVNAIGLAYDHQSIPATDCRWLRVMRKTPRVGFTLRNYPGFPIGVSGKELLVLLEEQASRFGVEVIRSHVGSLDRIEGGFSATTRVGETFARMALIATGIVDKAPAMRDLSEAIAAGSVRFCPVCDGYEATDRRIAVMGSSADACAKAKFLRTYSRQGYLASA